MPTKIDFKKKWKELYLPSPKEPVIVTVPKFNFIYFDGKGDPNGKAFGDAIGALYGMVYTVKFMLKLGPKKKDFVVPPLETLWIVSGSKDWDAMQKKRGSWQWRAMIAVPDFVANSDIAKAKKELKEKKNPPMLDKVKFGPFAEGKCVQIMHIGPYAKEKPTIDKMHAHAKDNGFTLHGKHHEIYLGDPRRTAPNKLKTVLRHPVKK